MKILLDSCVAKGARDDLSALGHSVVHVSDWADDPGDEAILAIAFREARLVVTLDKDFGQLVVQGRRPHAGIVRLVDVTARLQRGAVAQVIASHESDLLRQAIVTVESDRIRVRLPEPDPDGEVPPPRAQ